MSGSRQTPAPETKLLDWITDISETTHPETAPPTAATLAPTGPRDPRAVGDRNPSTSVIGAAVSAALSGLRQRLPLPPMRRTVETSSHWGTYQVEVSEDGREVVSARPYADDPDASPAIGNVAATHGHRSRVARPSIRRRWLEGGAGPDPTRGEPGDEYVEVDWDVALDVLATELSRVRSDHGDNAVYGGSYGWGSAGRLHHAQSQLHRFLNRTGGYTSSVNDYSRGASLVLLPHLIGASGHARAADEAGVLGRPRRAHRPAGELRRRTPVEHLGGARRPRPPPGLGPRPGGRTHHPGGRAVGPARRQLRRPRRRVGRRDARDRHRGDPGADPRAGRRRPRRRRVPGDVHGGCRRGTPLRAGPERRRREDAGVGRADQPGARRPDPGPRPRDGRRPDGRQRRLLGAARRARGAGGVRGTDPGRLPRPDRAARRRVHPRLRLDGGLRRGRGRHQAADLPAGRQPGARLHPVRAHLRPAAASR